MSIRNRYLLTKNAEYMYKNNQYSDILTLPLQKFVYTKAPLIYTLTEIDIERFDVFTFNQYGTCDYDDILLMLNNVYFKHDLEIGQTLIIPDLVDLENFFLKYIQ